MSTPTVVIIGRPNVGKSLLFNVLLGRRVALVHGKPGMTLDFLRERLRLPPPHPHDIWLTDTGGSSGETGNSNNSGNSNSADADDDFWQPLIEGQRRQAAAAADLFLLVVDYQTGLLPADAQLARELRRRGAAWHLLINKSEGADDTAAAAEFYALGAPLMRAVSAKHGRGINAVREQLARHFSPQPHGTAAAAEESAAEEESAAQNNKDNKARTRKRIKKPEEISAIIAPSVPSVAVVGRPNVGKSTLINRLLGDARLAVSSRPGTTRDAVSCELAHKDGAIVLLDTAGLRRRRAQEEREKLGSAATKRALAAADCALLLIDLSDGLTAHDKRILSLIQESGAAAAIAANKADKLPPAERARALQELRARLPLPRAPLFMLSAAAPRPLPAARLLAALRAQAAEAYRTFPTAAINSALAEIIAARAPRQLGKTRPKLRYAHQGGKRPPCIVIHGNALTRIDDSYRRYLSAAFMHKFSLTGNAIKIIFRTLPNPYNP